MDSQSTTTGRQGAQNDSPEQLLDVFKAAALSVTKLYKSSVAAEARARSDGYQDCLDDLFTFLEKEGTTIGEPGLSKIRKWATEGRDGRDARAQSSESDDDAYKPESTPATESDAPVSSTEMTVESKSDAAPAQATPPGPSPVEVIPVPVPPPHFVVPSQDNFTFQTDYPYPNISNLDLSDTRPHLGIHHHHSRSKARFNNSSSKSGPRGSLGRGAGSKRKMDLDDLFGGYFGGKDPFGGNGKRSRHS